MRPDEIERTSNNIEQCSKMIEDCSHCVRGSRKLPEGFPMTSTFQHDDVLPHTCRARQPIGSEHKCRSKAPALPRPEDVEKRLCACRLYLILQFMYEGKIGHHHAKCLGPVHSAEYLSANSFQLIGDLERQRKYESGVDTLKWNVQPLVVVERNKLRLRGLSFETHDDVLSEGVLSPDFQHSEKLVEIALGESGIDGQPELSTLLCGSNDSALRSGYGFLYGGHEVSLSGCILQHRYKILKDHSQTDSNKRSLREWDAGRVVDLLHGGEGFNPHEPQQGEPWRRMGKRYLQSLPAICNIHPQFITLDQGCPKNSNRLCPSPLFSIRPAPTPHNRD